MLTFTATVIIGYYTYRKTSVARDAFARSGISSQLPNPQIAPAVPSLIPKSRNLSVSTLTKPYKPPPGGGGLMSYSIIIDPGKINSFDAGQIAQHAQFWAAQISACLADPNHSDDDNLCVSVFASDITGLRDDLHNRGIEIPELNEVVNELESHPSKKLLATAPSLLRAIADKLVAHPKEQAPELQNAPEKPPEKQATNLQGDTSEVIVLAKPIILAHGALDAYDTKIIVSTAQRTAAEILSCLAEPHGSPLLCVFVHGTSVTGVRDDLHNHGVEFAELNASVKQLESSPSDAGLKHAASVLRAVADQLIVMSQAPKPPDQPKEQAPVVRSTKRVDWHDKQNWRKSLWIGMSRMEVRQLFGNPKKISVVRSSEYWYYQSFFQVGYIVFNMDGHPDGSLESWDEP